MPPKLAARGRGRGRAKARPKAKAAAKAGPKAKARVRLRPGHRRPAAAAGVVAPNPFGEEIDLKGVGVEELLKIKILRIKGRYWEAEVEVAGKPCGIEHYEGEPYLNLKVEGTKSESVLRYLSGQVQKGMRVHLCPNPCTGLVWQDDLIHLNKAYKWIKEAEEWMTNSRPVVPEEGPEENDELKLLRREARGVGAEAPGRKEERQRSRSRKKKKKEKEKEESEESRKKKKKELKVKGKKEPAVIFGQTGLDPDPEIREKVSKRGRRIAKKEKKSKKKKEETSDSSSGGSGSKEEEASAEDLEGGNEGLFGQKSAVKRISKQCPGALTAAWLQEAQSHLMTSHGMVWDTSQTALQPLPRTNSAESVGAYGSRVSDTLLLGGPLHDGESGGKPGCSSAKAEKPLIHGEWNPLLHLPAHGVVAPGHPDAGFVGRGATSGQGGQGRTKGLGEPPRAKELVKQCWRKRRRQKQGQRRQRKEGKDKGWKAEGRWQERWRCEEGLLKWEDQEQAGEEKREIGTPGRTMEEETGFKGKGKKVDAESPEREKPEDLGGAEDSGTQMQHHSLEVGDDDFLRRGVMQILSVNSVLDFTLANVGGRVLQCIRLCCKPWYMVKEPSEFLPYGPLTGTTPEDPAKAEWLEAVVLALCHLSGTEFSEDSGLLRDPAVKRNVCAQLERFDMWREVGETVELQKFFNSKGVSYTGDEVKLAQQLNWKAVSSSLPDGVGGLDLCSLCSLGTLEYVKNFENYLIPEEMQLRIKPPAVMVEDGGWPELASGLLQKGVCKVIPLSDVHHIGDKPLLNGLFAVGKQEWVGPLETQRLIMNLTPVNSLVRELQGDLATLPSLATLGQMILGEDELCVISSEDVRCFFYLFRTPDCWHKYMAFNKTLPDDLVPECYKGRPCVLAATVLPMGFQGSVAIAQHVHRNVLKEAALTCEPKVGGQGEIRKDMGFPQCKDRYRIYLDNFDQLEVVDQAMAAVIQGTTSSLVESVQKTYATMKIPRHPKKAVARSVRAEVQGSLILGDKGIAIPKPQKVLQYVSMGLQLLKQGEAQLKEMQVVCGGFVYMSTFRRPLLSGLNGVWRFKGDVEIIPPGCEATPAPCGC